MSELRHESCCDLPSLRLTLTQDGEQGAGPDASPRPLLFPLRSPCPTTQPHDPYLFIYYSSVSVHNF
jgi:hypothetical protein